MSYCAIEEYIPREQDIIIDCGANVGFYSIFASKFMRGKGKIYAIEPLSYNYKRLLFQLKMNNVEKCYPINIAILDRQGDAEILRPCASTSSTLFSKHLEALSRKYGANERIFAKERVKVTTLDDIDSSFAIERVDILKIDVEGSELHVLRGAKKTLDITKRLILEVHESVSLEEIINELINNNRFCIEKIFTTHRWKEVIVYAKRKEGL